MENKCAYHSNGTSLEATNKIGGITLYHGDCLDVLPTLADGSISACIADLSYGCLNKSNKHAQCDKELPLDALWEQWKVSLYMSQQ